MILSNYCEFLGDSAIMVGFQKSLSFRDVCWSIEGWSYMMSGICVKIFEVGDRNGGV